MNELYDNIYEKLANLQWLMHRQQMAAQMETGPFADRTRGQGRVLAMLKIQPEISTKDLSYLLGIRQQSLNELLNKLEKNGYIVRMPSEADKRVMVIHLTEKGKETQQEESPHKGIFDSLSEEELLAFEGYLDRIITSLEAITSDMPDQDMEDWMDAARSRMGDEKFERLMSMRQGGVRRNRHGRGPADMPGAGHFERGFGGPGPGHGSMPPRGHGRRNPEDR